MSWHDADFRNEQRKAARKAERVTLEELEKELEGDAVKKPSHYQIFPGLEAIEVIAMSSTKQEFYGYCKGNMLKYRLRAGAKDDLKQDIGKANQYLELYTKHKHLCRPRD